MKVVPKNLSSVFKAGGTFEHVGATCPHCGFAAAAFDSIGYVEMAAKQVFAQGHQWGGVKAGKCKICMGLVLGVYNEDGAGHRYGVFLWPGDEWPDSSPPGLEDDIKAAYDEARSILALSPRAAATLARRCLQDVIRKKLGIKEKNLFHEIAKAVEGEELTRPTKDSLDHVREIGNWGAHSIEDQSQTIIDVTADEAAYTLEVLELVFQDLYATPDRTAEMAKRLAKKKAGK
jgi:hypothetical protein